MKNSRNDVFGESTDLISKRIFIFILGVKNLIMCFFFLSFFLQMNYYCLGGGPRGRPDGREGTPWSVLAPGST
jgi:hypothetical protein